jgi:hypothetical protein
MEVHRREFLKKALFAGALIGAAPLGAACSGVKRADLKTEEQAAAQVPGLDARGLSVLSYAALAPSGHNSQPWFVRVLEPNRWVIGADPERRLPAVDPENREAMLSLGAFAENLALAAGALGLKAEMRILARSAFEREIIEVALAEAKPETYPLERLARRMTVKHGYLPVEIRQEDLAAIEGDLKGRLFYFPRGSEHARCIEESAVESFRLQTERDEAQRELVHWLRLSAADARRQRDGLTTEGMEITGLKGWFVRTFLKPEDFLKPSARQQGVELTRALAREGGGWLVVTSDGNAVSDWIETGRRFERLALAACGRKIGLHPMTQVLEEPSGREQIAASHKAGLHPQFVLRVGYLADIPEPVSLRRPPAWFIRPD